MPQASSLNAPIPAQVQVQFALTNAMVAGQVVGGVVFPLGTQYAGTAQPSVPPDEVWHFVDIYETAAMGGGDADFVINILVGTTPQYINVDTAAILVTNNSRKNPFLSSPLTILPNKTWQVQAILDIAPTAATETEIIFIDVLREPLATALARKGR
jgi:hypothetical protein